VLRMGLRPPVGLVLVTDLELDFLLGPLLRSPLVNQPGPALPAGALTLTLEALPVTDGLSLGDPLTTTDPPRLRLGGLIEFDLPPNPGASSGVLFSKPAS